MREDGTTTRLGERLKALRLGMGLSIVAAAKATGVSKTHVWNLENRDVNPSRELLIKLAAVYGVGVAELVREDPEPLAEEPRMVALFRDLRGLSERDLSAVEGLVKRFKGE